MQVVTTDVAVVGGGAAGCYAALNLGQRGIKPLIICKGLVGKSGASLFAGNLVISGRALGNSTENARNTAEFLIKYHNQFLIDQNWAQRCGQWVEKVYYPELEEAGLYFRRDDSGEVVTSPGKIRSIVLRFSTMYPNSLSPRCTSANRYCQPVAPLVMNRLSRYPR